MNRILYESRCRCNEEFSITKKRKSPTRSEGKPLQYPKSNEITSKTFQIKYEKKLSATAKFILNSFQNKYIYYAIDDILYLFNLKPSERNNLLAILYSPVLSLHNNFSVNFFDIWVSEIYIDEKTKINKFLNKSSGASDQTSYITVKLFYKTKVPVKKQESLW
jgi:hypothetical protein|uniref:Uncharacterized protein n=2 Tax=Phaeodactylum tricornutum TaxID=2850 RepID=A0T0I3_PHATC|nr:hypothetical protein PhtrCp101 [Phaeodactylum tricornutum]ABK20681.1 conserved hypothetical protein [Phaeodactylum tricornutum]QHR85635.1 conserved hypothetical protein [Phaeodactylum tricornutum]